MKKLYLKLIAAIVTITVAFSMVVVSTYAWMTMSTSPIATGIQIAISGGNTILVAPDIRVEKDGEICHYPGQFADTLNFTKSEAYSYLSELYGLLPVSTVDGQNWILPTYYTAADSEVQFGSKPAGEIKPIRSFALDSTLQFANLKELPEQARSQGSYVYVDFWVVSPGAEYTLHISAGDGDDGSFVIDLPRPEETDSGYTLVEPQSCAGYSARIGFLINQDMASAASLEQYRSSADYSGRYDNLLGQYQEKGEDAASFPYSQHRFLIYEPNADGHSADSDTPDGSYCVTKPLAWRNGTIVEANLNADELAVQLQSDWKMGLTDTTMLEQAFQTAIAGKNPDELEQPGLFDTFYGEYLQNQVGHYAAPGRFVARANELYACADGTGIVEANEVGDLEKVTAPDMQLVHLERNVPQRIRMFIWLEGQDVDCRDGVALSEFAMAVTLAGSSERDE